MSPATQVEKPSEPAPAGSKLNRRTDPVSFSREDWTLFRSLTTLAQKAGVPEHHLGRLVMKELVDNALDAGANVEVDEAIAGGYIIRDDGPGLGTDPQRIADLFSIGRPLVSTKLLRLPTRGALGNGLRVVAGAVLASGGDLVVKTCGHRHVLRPQDDGSTAVESEPVEFTTGTVIEIQLGSSAGTGNALLWAHTRHPHGERGARPTKANRHRTGMTWMHSTSFAKPLAATPSGSWSSNWTAAQAAGPAR